MPNDIIITPGTARVDLYDSSDVIDTAIDSSTSQAISFIGNGSGSSTPSTILVTINDNSSGTLVPGTTGYGLGTLSLRWATFASALDANTVKLSTGAFTGGILFTNASSLLTTDNAAGGDLFWDSTNHRLGIGTASAPDGPLHIEKDAGADKKQNPGIRLTNQTASTSSVNQNSPALGLGGTVWNTSGTPASNYLSWRQDVRGISSGAPVGYLVFSSFASASSTLTDHQTFLSLGSDGTVNVLLPQPVVTPTVTAGGTLAAGTYYYKVTAVDMYGREGTGLEVSATTASTNLTIALAWTAIPDAVTYNIYRATASNGYAAPAFLVNQAAVSYSDTGGTSLTGTNLPPLVPLATRLSARADGTVQFSGPNIQINALDTSNTGPGGASERIQLYAWSGAGTLSSSDASIGVNSGSTLWFAAQSAMSWIVAGTTFMSLTGLGNLAHTPSTGGWGITLANVTSASVTSPSSGALIYDTALVKFYNGSTWLTVLTSASKLLSANTSIPGGNTLTGSGLGTNTYGAFSSQYVIPANFLVAGQVLRIWVAGLWSSDGTTPGTITIQLRAGSTVLLSTAGTMGAGVTNKGWILQDLVIVNTIGAGGTLESQEFTDTRSQFQQEPNTATLSLDTTTNQTIACYMKFSSALSTNTYTLRQFIVEILQ